MKPPGSFRVVSWNIRSCLEQGLEAVAEVINSLGADVIGLQEVDRLTVRSGATDQTAELAARCGFDHYRFFPATPWEGGGEYGIALLSKHQLLDPQLMHMPIDGPEAHPSATEPRVLAMAQLKGGVRILNTHFGLTESQRSRQAAFVAEQAARRSPTIVVGDFNATPLDPVLDPLHAQLNDASADLSPAERVSFPLPAPGKAIDYVFVSPDLRVLAARVETAAAGASDHWPLVVDLGGPGLS